MSETPQHANIEALQAEAEDCFIGIREVCRIAGFSKSSILRRVKAGTFPEPVIVEGNITRWSLFECRAWRSAQFEKRSERLGRPDRLQ